VPEPAGALEAVPEDPSLQPSAVARAPLPPSPAGHPGGDLLASPPSAAEPATTPSPAEELPAVAGDSPPRSDEASPAGDGDLERQGPPALAVELLPPLTGAAPPPAPSPVAKPATARWGLAAALFVLTFLTTTTLGAVWVVSTRTDLSTFLDPVLSPSTILGVWHDPAMLRLGLSFSLPLLFILLCHELGHFLACRHYRIPATPPFFLPAPIALGTLGAFIRIKAPIRGRRELFDVGVAGPLAGFVALLPFLVLGVAWSTVGLVREVPLEQANMALFLPGRSLAVTLVSWLVHGPLPAAATLDYHPFALAAWFGLLATSLNLLPIGQLDGGHILYAANSELHRRLGVPVLLTLAAVAFVWPGWLLWGGLVLLLSGLRHPPVRDAAEPLDPVRRRLAWVALLLLVLSFMPVPLRQVPVTDLPPPGTVLASAAAR
jgi:hypothetical protein